MGKQNKLGFPPFLSRYFLEKVFSFYILNLKIKYSGYSINKFAEIRRSKFFYSI
jgi:hypothetical protein